MGMVPLVCPIPLNFTIHSDIVLNLLTSIKIHKAAGPDDIPSWILRDHAFILAHPICTIFNASIREGFLPPFWKCVNVIPIPKVNPPHAINRDLRPISQTAVLLKQLERIVGGWMIGTIADKLDVDQYDKLNGFISIIRLSNKI